MAKRHNTPEPTSSRGAMLILVAGGVLVAALVIWALTRTVEPAAPVADGGAVGTTEAPVLSTQPGTATDPTAPVATQTAPPRPEGDPSSVKRIAVEDLRAQVNRGGVTVIDVRDARAFATRHIPGSLNIPFASIETQLDQIPKDKPIVLYCT